MTNEKNITYFGEIEISSPEGTYDGEVSIDNRPIALDLNFYEGVPSYDWVNEYENYVGNLQQHKANVEAAFQADYEEEGETKEYVNFHFEEFDASEVDEILADTDASKSREERLLSLLKLERIGFYPGEEDYTVWDYTIGSDITNHIVVVRTDSKGEIREVAWES